MIRGDWVRRGRRVEKGREKRGVERRKRKKVDEREQEMGLEGKDVTGGERRWNREKKWRGGKNGENERVLEEKLERGKTRGEKLKGGM